MKFINKLKNVYEESDKKTLFVYLLLRFLIIICMLRELYNGNASNALLCVFSLILLLLPFFIEKAFKVDLPSILEIIILTFIFSAEILGEINNYYVTVKNFDTILHTINGFLCASIGFSLVYLLNKNIDCINLSPFFVALVSFCFSMTVGVVWEFFEYGMDNLFNLDMQKDRYIYKLNTVILDPKNENNVITVDNIDYTILYNAENELIRLEGYLDIGLHDTMKDLIVNFIGALVYSVFGYLYIINEEKYRFASKFMIKGETNENNRN